MISDKEPFVDSHTLQAALFHAQRRSPALTDFVVRTKQFEEIDGNSMVKDKLVEFLNADIAHKNAKSEYARLSKLVRLNRWSKVRRAHEERLAELLKTANEAFEEFEMIRKLALPNNSLLMLKRPTA